MNIQRQLRVAIVIGVAGGMVGCKAPGGSFFGWGKGGDSAVSSAPDLGKQKYEGLSQEFADGPSKSGATTALGAQKPAAEQNMFTAAWSKTTGAVSAAFAGKSASDTPRDALSLDNKSKKLGPEVYVSAARLLENQNKLDQAEEKYQQALKLAPRDVNTLVSLARLQDRQGKPALAVETYGKALQVEPQSSLVHNDLGLCFARQGNVPQSLTHLNQAAKLQPTNPKYRNNLASVLVDAQRIDEAYSHLAAISPPAVAHYNLAYLLQQRGQTAAADQQLQQSLAADPNLAPAAAMLAQLRGGPAVETAQRPAPQMGPGGYGAPSPQYQSPGTSSPLATPVSSSHRRINHEEEVEAAAPAAKKITAKLADDSEPPVDEQGPGKASDAQPADAEPVVLSISDHSSDDEDSPAEPALLPLK